MYLIRAVAIAGSMSLVLLQGCNRIPNRVMDREYEVYSAWTKEYVKTTHPNPLYIYSRTGGFDPLSPNGCGDRLHIQDGVAWSLIKQLHALGDAQYPLDVYQHGSHPLTDGDYEEINSPPKVSQQPQVHAVTFTRVAFNEAGTEALFAVSATCGLSECGSGGAILARKIDENWNFRRPQNCQWVF
jgi:hypothetical protein